MAQDLNVSVENTEKKGSSIFTAVAIVVCILLGIVVWKFVLGAESNFNDGAAKHAPNNILGTMYLGGYIVPILLGFFLMTITFSVERFMVLSKVAGKGNLDNFVKDVVGNIKSGDVKGALAACDAQQGSVANVVRAGLVKSEQVKADGLDVEKATENITKEIEQATTLEMPMLEKNMTVLSTLVSIGTLCGLLGTVSGMIKAFQELGAAGTPDQAALAVGISEALVNTLTGIATSTFAIIAYNYFTSKIDTLTYYIDEAGFAITQAYKRSK